MASFNKVILVGNLTRDVEIRYTQSGTAVTDIGLAVNDRVKRDGQWVDEATFVDITLWGRTAEVASEYLSKGAPVLIEGRLKLDSWEQNGEKKYKLRVVGERMQMLGGRGGGSQGGPNQAGHAGSGHAGSGHVGSGQAGSGQAGSGQAGSGQGGGDAFSAPVGQPETGGPETPNDDIPF